MKAAHWRARRWNGLALSIFIMVIANLTVATNGTRIDEPWPNLLPSESAAVDPDVSLLQQRASLSLEKLVRSVPPPAQPL